MTQWREQRDRAVAAHSAALERQRAAEAAQGRELVADFVREAKARGLQPEPLSAQSYNGSTRFKTKLRGWYLNQARTIAVGEDAKYYVLLVPHSFQARFTGVAPAPQDPPKIVGEGGRDGESMPLKEMLVRRLSQVEG